MLLASCVGVDPTNIDITCPVCQKSSSIELTDEFIGSISSGVAQIEIPRDYLCEHHFVVFVDQNGGIRGYSQIDLTVEQLLKERSPPVTKPTFQQLSISLTGLVSVMGEDSFTRLLHSLFIGQEAVIIDEDERFYTILRAFLSTTFPPGTLKAKAIVPISRKQLDRLGELLGAREHLVYDTLSSTITQDPNPKDSRKYLAKLLRRLLAVSDQTAQELILTNEARKVLEMARLLSEWIQDSEVEDWSAIRERLEKHFKTKVNAELLDFIAHVATHRYHVTLPTRRRIESLLDEF